MTAPSHTANVCCPLTPKTGGYFIRNCVKNSGSSFKERETVHKQLLCHAYTLVRVLTVRSSDTVRIVEKYRAKIYRHKNVHL